MLSIVLLNGKGLVILTLVLLNGIFFLTILTLNGNVVLMLKGVRVSLERGKGINRI